jgi:hypothetical protein
MLVTVDMYSDKQSIGDNAQACLYTIADITKFEALRLQARMCQT